MSDKKKSVSYNGTGIASLLTVLFVGLKLTGNIGWSWWWVLSPLWISFLLIVFVVLVILGIALLINK